MKVELNINNASKIVYPYIVARRAEDGSVWYWGQYKDKAEADRWAVEIGNGFVVEAIDHDDRGNRQGAMPGVRSDGELDAVAQSK